MSDERVARAREIAEALLDKKGVKVVALDVRDISSFADTFVLASGTSDRHVRTLADAVRDHLARAGERPLGVEGYDEGRWVLIDLGDAVVHVFLEEVRQHYDLERLWSDAPRMDLDDLIRQAESAAS